jgi:hypothetical protein
MKGKVVILPTFTSDGPFVPSLKITLAEASLTVLVALDFNAETTGLKQLPIRDPDEK